MEWVVTTGKSVDEAKDRALDQLGVAADEAEFEIVEEARTGFFGRVKAEAQVRARIRPTQVRPKHDRRDRRRAKGRRDPARGDRDDKQPAAQAAPSTAASDGRRGNTETRNESSGGADEAARDSSTGRDSGKAGRSRQRSKRPRQDKESTAMNGESEREVPPQEVGEAAVAFMEGLTAAFGATAKAELTVDGSDLDVRVSGDELGLLVGPGGRTLSAVQDLARVASQRRLGDHDTRLRIDVGGYREKRRAALERFALAVAHEVLEQGRPKALEPMASADRKAVHDALGEVEGVSSRSEGEEPNRRVVIRPA